MLLGPHVDAACRVEEEKDTKTRCQPSADRDLLLIPAAEAAHLSLSPRIDLQSLDGVRNGHACDS